MDADEREIFDYLKTFGQDWVSAKEICRRAGGKKRYAEDNNWAKPILRRLKERNLIEGDALGRYRIKTERKRGHEEPWMAPDIEKILREDGVEGDAERAAAATESDEPL
jgi:hypothetical protein